MVVVAIRFSLQDIAYQRMTGANVPCNRSQLSTGSYSKHLHSAAYPQHRTKINFRPLQQSIFSFVTFWALANVIAT